MGLTHVDVAYASPNASDGSLNAESDHSNIVTSDDSQHCIILQLPNLFVSLLAEQPRAPRCS